MLQIKFLMTSGAMYMSRSTKNNQRRREKEKSKKERERENELLTLMEKERGRDGMRKTVGETRKEYEEFCHQCHDIMIYAQI